MSNPVMKINYIQPEWPAPPNIKAYCTLRTGGVSKPPFDSFNLATHVGDNENDVQKNRALLQSTLHLPTEPLWISQVHGIHAVQADTSAQNVTADASFTCKPNTICAVMTADCLPLLICDKEASYVAAIHAGWRGLAAGIIEHTIAKLPMPRESLLIWLGPAIGPTAFEVGAEIVELFAQHDKKARAAFQPTKDKWLGDIYTLAKQRLADCNINPKNIYGGEFCTYTDKDRFYSFRRDNITGRMANLIWISRNAI